MKVSVRNALALLIVLAMASPAGALAATPAATSAAPPAAGSTAASTVAQVRGVLLDAQGLPAVGHQIAVRSKAGDLFTSGPTGVDGTFVVADLPPDTYRLVAFGPDGTEFPVLGREVELKAGQVERLELRLGSPSGAPGRAARPVGEKAGWWGGLGTGTKIAIVTAGVFAVGLAVAGGGSDEPPVSAR